MHSRTGFDTSIFTCHLSTLKRLMSSHTVPNSSLDVRECRKLLIDHLTSASCLTLSDEYLTKGPACKHMAATCTSPNTMKYEIYKTLSSVSSSELPTDRLLEVTSLLSISYCVNDRKVRYHVQDKFAKQAIVLHNVPFDIVPLSSYFHNFDLLNLSQLHDRCKSHGIATPPAHCTKDKLRKLIIHHLSTSGCLQNGSSEAHTPPACSAFLKEWHELSSSISSFDIYTMSHMARKKGPRLKQLKLYLQGCTSGSPFDIPSSATLHSVQSQLKAHVKKLLKGKSARFSYSELVAKRAEYEAKLASLAAKWPDVQHCCSQHLKDHCIKRFRECTSSSSLQTFTCASCSENKLISERTFLRNDEFDEQILSRPDAACADIGRIPSHRWLDPDLRYSPPIVLPDHCSSDILVDP